MKNLFLAALHIPLLIALSASNLCAQIELTAVFEGHPAVTAHNLFTVPQNFTTDFTGDGTADMLFLHPDLEGATVLTIVDAADYTVWRGSIVNNTPYQASLNIVGCFDGDGSAGSAEIILAEKQGRRYMHPVVIDIDGEILWDGVGKILIGLIAWDNGTGGAIVAADPAVPQIEVYGRTNSNAAPSTYITIPEGK